ncbi:MAG: nitroreductase family protein [Candidatus Muiribacteriota bacterium]
MDFIQGIKERRAINFFDSSQEMSDKKIKNIINLANLTPSSMNLQPWELIVVKSKENKELLKKYAFNQPKVTETSINFIVVANPEGVEENINDVLNSWVKLGYMKEEHIENFKNNAFNLYKDKFSEKRIHFAIKNASFFAMSLMYAAQAYGFKTHPMDGFNEEKVKIKFKIAENKHIPVIIACGYPSPELNLLPRAYRRPVENFVKFI